MKAFLKTLKMAVCGLVVGVLALLVLPLFLSPSHIPKGNVMARLECYIYLKAIGSTKTDSVYFDFSRLSDDAKAQAIDYAYYNDFWIKTNFVWGTSSNREIVFVCPREFDNVHKSGFWNAFWRNPAHVVGYSDGRTGLISPEQFTNLNLSGFVSATNLVAKLFNK
jgi:hypothetical protein